MSKERIHAIEGQRIVIEVQSDVGFPVHIQIGDDNESAWIEKERIGNNVRVTAWRLCPKLGSGNHELIVHSPAGSRNVGTIII